MNRDVVAFTSQMLAEIPEDQLRGDDPIADGLDQLTDAELVDVAAAVAVTAKQSAANSPTSIKATKVLKTAAKVANAREKARFVLAKKLPYPEAFAASKAGKTQTAVAARRVRLGAPLTEKAGGTTPRAPREAVRRPMGPLRYYRRWVAEGKWGYGESPLRGFGLEDGGGLASIEATGIGAPRDAVEAMMMGGPRAAQAFGLQGLGSLAGLNFGKFFKNLAGAVGGIASIAGPIAMAIPGIGTAAGVGIMAAGNLANAISGKGQEQQQPQPLYAANPTYGPAPLPAPVQAESKTPAWLIPAVVAGGVLLLARK